MSDQQSTRLSMPFIQAGQAMKHITHNEALVILDVLVQASVEASDLQAPPDAGQGAVYVIPSGASGDWAGRDGQLAVRQGEGWQYLVPAEGWAVFDKSAGTFLVRKDDVWVSLSETVTIDRVEKLGVAADADTTNRLSLAGEASLFSHDGQGHQIKINRAAEGDTAGLLFQTDYVTGAEIGFTGDDIFRVKVSDDGVQFKSVLRIDPSSGNVGINADPENILTVIGNDYVRIGNSMFNASDGPGPAMEIQSEASGNRQAYFDFHSCDEWSDYSARFIRVSGQNGAFDIINRGTGGISFKSLDGGAIRFVTASSSLLFTQAGEVGIGKSPKTTLDVEGPIRPGQYTEASLPAATANNEGALAYLVMDNGTRTIVFSDGSAWNPI